MPPIVTILIVLALAVLAVIMITSKNPTNLTPDQAQKYAKILRILVPVLLIATAIKFFFMGG